MIPISYNVRNLTVRKATTAASALGLALVVFVFASVLMLSNGIKKVLGRTASPDVAIVLRKGSGAELESSIDDSPAKLAVESPEVAMTQGSAGGPGAKSAVGELVAVIILDKVGTDGVANVTVRGVPDNAYAFRPTMKIVAGQAPKPGTDEVAVGKAIRGRFKGLDLGGSIELRKNRPVKVVGVFEDEGSSYESEVWSDLNTARAAFGREGLVSSVRVRLLSESKFDTYKTFIESNRQLGLSVTRETDYLAKQSEGTSIFITALGFLIFFFFSIGAMIGALITMHATVANRQREIGTLRALGFSKVAILFSFVVESTLLGLVGGLVGAGAASLMGFVKISMMNFATFAEMVFAFEPTPGILVLSVFVSGFMGLLGGFFPALRASLVSPVAAMRGA
ncbi:MAG: ABC transporter permease [Polyangiaceae bacterium]